MILTDLSMQVSEESSQLVEEERPRPQGSSPVEEFPEAAKHIDAEVKLTEKGVSQIHDPKLSGKGFCDPTGFGFRNKKKRVVS